MFFFLPLQLLDEIMLFLPMDPGGIRELRTVCVSTARTFTDANLRNISLDIDPIVLIRESLAYGGLLRFTDQITAWFTRIQRARAIRHLDVTLACRSDVAIHVMNALRDLLGVTLSVTEASLHPRSLRDERAASAPITALGQQHKICVAGAACGRLLRIADEPLVRPKPKINKAAEKAANDRRVVADRRAAGVMDILKRLRLADTGRDSFSGHALHHILSWPLTTFPVLEHLSVILRTWHAPSSNAAHDTRGPMSDLAHRFPRLSHLTLCGTRWDGCIWEPTVRNIAKAPPTLRSLRLCFHAQAEEAVVWALSLALRGGALEGLEDLRLRSTRDIYDSFDADRGGNEFRSGGGDSGVKYTDKAPLAALGKGLGRLAASLRRLEVWLQCDSNEHNAHLLTEMGLTSKPRGMVELTRLAMHMCPVGLADLAELVQSGQLPSLAFLEVARPSGHKTAAAVAVAAARDSGKRAQLLRRLDDPLDKLHLKAQFDRLQLAALALSHEGSPQPSYALDSGIRLILALSSRKDAAANKLHTLSLDLGPVGRKGGGMQEAIAALLVSGSCPRLRRLWLFSREFLEEEGKEEVVFGGDGDVLGRGGKDGRSHGLDDGRGKPGDVVVQANDGAAAERPSDKRNPSSEEDAPTTPPPSDGNAAADGGMHNQILSTELLSALTSPRCPPALAEAFADGNSLSLRIPAPDRWWGV